MNAWIRTSSAWVVGLLLVLPGTGEPQTSAQEAASGALLEALEKAMGAAPPTATPGVTPAPPLPGQTPVARDGPAPARARLDYQGLVPGKSTRVDVDFQLGDPVETSAERVVYGPSQATPGAERLEAAFVKDTRVLYRLDVRLASPLPYDEVARQGGRRVLLDPDDAGRVWEYRVPGFLALGYPATPDGPPPAVHELRYASPQLLADRFVARGRKAEADKRWDDALTEFEKATRVDPTYAAGYLWMGVAWEGKGDRRQALLHYTAAAQAGYPAATKAAGHYRAGLLHLEDGQAELALRAFNRALDELPSHARAHFQVGLTYHGHLRKPKEALAAYQKAVALKPDYDVAHFNIGLLHQDARDARAALAAFQKAVDHAPAWTKASHRLMAQAVGLGEYLALEREARRRLGVQSDDTVAMVNLALALAGQLPDRAAVIAFLSSLGNEDARLKEALEWLERAVAAGYGDRKMLDESPHLQKLRDQAPLAYRRIVGRIDKPRG